MSAWLFGINLLRLRADVVLVPADVRRADDSGVVRTGVRVVSRDGATRAERSGREGVRAAWNGQATLGDARRLLGEADQSLERMVHAT